MTTRQITVTNQERATKPQSRIICPDICVDLWLFLTDPFDSAWLLSVPHLSAACPVWQRGRMRDPSIGVGVTSCHLRHLRLTAG